jgi:hypothetical protein
MPAIGDLDGLRCRSGAGLPVSAAALTRDDAYSGVARQPCLHRAGLTIREKVDDASTIGHGSVATLWEHHLRFGTVVDFAAPIPVAHGVCSQSRSAPRWPADLLRVPSGSKLSSATSALPWAIVLPRRWRGCMLPVSKATLPRVMRRHAAHDSSPLCVIGTIQVNILSSGHLRVKSGTNFKEARYAPTNYRAPLIWFCDAAENL